MKQFNYFPDPLGTGKYVKPFSVIDGSVHGDWANIQQGFALRSKAEGLGAYAAWMTPKMSAGAKMVFLCRVGSISSSDEFRGRLISITKEDDTYLAETPVSVAGNSTVRLPFTVPDSGRVVVKFRGKKGDGAMMGFYETRIVPEGQDESFFYYDTLPLPSR